MSLTNMDYKLAVLIFACVQLCAAYPSNTAFCECTRNYEPICSSDGETYNNECLFKCVQSTQNYLRLVKYGPCEDTPRTGICNCSLDEIPVCGNDGRTYPNTCHVSCKAMTNPTLRVAYQGECKYGQVMPRSS